MHKCPLCGCTIFFVRDPDDEYEIMRFELTSKGIVFEDDPDPKPELTPDRDVYCDRCSWHGPCAQLSIA